MSFLQDDIDMIENDELNCEDFLFCKSLVPSLKRLDRKSNARIKIKIRQSNLITSNRA